MTGELIPTGAKRNKNEALHNKKHTENYRTRLKDRLKEQNGQYCTEPSCNLNQKYPV